MAEEKNNAITQVESNSLDLTETGKEGKALQQTIAEATEAEHELSVRDALRNYLPAVLWALCFQMAVIMEGYDTNLLSNFFVSDRSPKYGGLVDPTDHRFLRHTPAF